MAYTRRSFSDTAVKTTLTADVTSTDTAFPVAATTGWTTTNGPIVATIDRGTTSEEKVEVTAFTSSSMTVTRGYGGTTPQTHSNGAAVEHTICGTDLDEANLTVSKTVGLIAAAGDILVADGPNSLKKIAKGTSSQVLTVGGSDSSGLEWATPVPTALLANATFTTTEHVVGTTWAQFTGYSATFTAPTSGDVLVRLTAYCELEGAGSNPSTSGYAFWGVANNSGGAVLAGTAILGGPISSSNQPAQCVSAALKVTGLTAGNSYTLNWVGASDSSNDGIIIYAGSTPTPGSSNFGPALMEVWAA